MKTAKQILKEQMRKECHTSQEVDEWYTEYSDTFSTVLKAMEAYAAQFTTVSEEKSELGEFVDEYLFTDDITDKALLHYLKEYKKTNK